MTKTQLIDLFGSQAEVGRMIGISRAAVCEWENKIPTRLADEIVGACLRTGRFSYEMIADLWDEYGEC